MKEKLIDKIKKLLALAGNNSNESEAMAAMAKVQELLAENNLSMADIPEGEREDDDETVMENYSDKKRHQKWQVILLLALAKINECEYFAYHDNTRVIVGRKNRIEIVRSMADYLFSLVERETKAAKADHTRQWITDFKLGMAVRIAQRLKERHAQDTESTVISSNGQQGAIILRREIDTLLATKGIRLRSRSLGASYRRGNDGFVNGKEAGNRAGLHNQVGGGRSPSRRMIGG